MLSGLERALSPLVDRFVGAFDDFVVCLRAAIAHASNLPLGVNSGDHLNVWTRRALPLLEGDLADIHSAADDFRRGNTGPILRQAERQGALAKNLDGCPLGFAGSTYEKMLDEAETIVVETAYQLCQATGLR